MTDQKNHEKQNMLKKIIKDLHAGIPVEELQKKFAKILKQTSPEEIANMENALIQEGFPPEEIQRLCDVHARVFEKSLARVGKSSKMPGHPIHTFIQENKQAKKILKYTLKIAKKISRGSVKNHELKEFSDNFNRLKEIEKHYLRKENQLFPALEKKKFTGPTQVMWGKHNEIRDHLKKTAHHLNKKEWPDLYRQFKILASAIKKMIFLEEKILYPTSAKKLTEYDWTEIKRGESEIGYAWITPANMWDANLARNMSINKNKEVSDTIMKTNTEQKIPLSQGQLTAKQIDLLLKSLPVDITFVDQNDRVCYYSDTKERIFPRSAGIIGREVQNCHPPKSAHIVKDIIKNFKDRKKEVAEFWIKLDNKLVYIRYFPVYDENKEYCGVIEVSQDISQIKTLEGEHRLLDW